MWASFFRRLTYFVNTETFPKNIRRFWHSFPKQCPSGPRTSVGCGSKRSESYTISPWSSWCWCLGREKESEGEFLFPIKKSKKSKDNYGREGSIKKGRSVAALEKKNMEKMSIKVVC